ncbi:hypothetical protein AB0N05_08825 [Nocardia sp. NPDC051030]|uniref:hypothetical protein n=1 Tax=Nocardia sp. NPDC051030 TaxID=3155162 RepID=UPI00344950FA
MSTAGPSSSAIRCTSGAVEASSQVHGDAGERGPRQFPLHRPEIVADPVDLADVVFVENGAVREKHTYVDGVAMQAAFSTPAEIA